MSDESDTPSPDDRRAAVRERYATVADDCCSSSCCGVSDADLDERSRQVGYSDEQVEAVAGDANLGLGCGTPVDFADLQPGETVLDLGSGAGFDCFLAAREVGPSGRVVGVDMTPEMLEKARRNAEANDGAPVEFRLGEIEHLPVADASVDVVVSNCVVNLSPEKAQVFAEAFRALRPGGRLAISDVVRTADIPDAVLGDPDSLASCVSGAVTVSRLERLLEDAGFEAVRVRPKAESAEFIREWADEYDPSDYVVSARIEARKPA